MPAFEWKPLGVLGVQRLEYIEWGRLEHTDDGSEDTFVPLVCTPTDAAVVWRFAQSTASHQLGIEYCRQVWVTREIVGMDH